VIPGEYAASPSARTAGRWLGDRGFAVALLSRRPANRRDPGPEESLTPAAAPAVEATAEDTRA
jgi:hypothetical protein